MTEFNFDEWVVLFKNHPEEANRKRDELIHTEILKAPVHLRGDLRVTQMECDALHTLEPLHAMVAISKLMLGKSAQLKPRFIELQHAVDDFTVALSLHYEKRTPNI